MHASINIHISQTYYPPKKGKRDTWEPNPERFMEQYGSHPDRIKNLHFAFVVTLRALRKAAPFLQNFPFSTNNATDDRVTKSLVQRLLDSHILNSCDQVFSAFDESLLFSPANTTDSTAVSLKKEFKLVFQNISRLLDCVSCQKCRLHGKVQLLGLGTALQILLLPDHLVASSLSKDEVVSLFNAVGKLSGAILATRELTEQFRIKYGARDLPPPPPPPPPPLPLVPPTQISSSVPIPETILGTPKVIRGQVDVGLQDAAIGVVAKLAREKRISLSEEDRLIDESLAGNPAMLLLAKHYSTDSTRFLRHALRNMALSPVQASKPEWDAVVVGGGLAGLTAALIALDRGGNVVILEKEGLMGGNSQWASSGINGVVNGNTQNDTITLYQQDCETGGKAPHIPVLTSRSGDAIEFLRNRGGLVLDKIGQLGGHSAARTYRPSTGMAGQELVYALQRAVKEFASDRVIIKSKTKVTGLRMSDDGAAVTGVNWENVKDKSTGFYEAPNVVIATGGFASGGVMLKKYRPDLQGFPTTNGLWATGDGLAMAEDVGAEMVGIKDVQVHPTAFVDTKSPEKPKKMLCAEILRGVGGILLDRTGSRFVNELGKRDYVTGRMLESKSFKVSANTFSIVLNGKAAAIADKHVPLYTEKGLLLKFETLSELATHLKVSKETLLETFASYTADSEKGEDQYGKKFFHNMNWVESGGPWYAGFVTPALHYTMGGIKVSPDGEVLKADGTSIQGLYAAGEAVGGVHGQNRLGGNALTECVVFGKLVGEKMKIGGVKAPDTGNVSEAAVPEAAVEAPAEKKSGVRKVTKEELAKHDNEKSCWVSLHGNVYDFTDFLEDHPAGPEAILEYGGKDGTDIFDKVHSKAMLDDFEPIGVMV